MHLHGFHFTVEPAGDGSSDRQLSESERRTVVTEAMATRPDIHHDVEADPARNWLFHCHMVGHMSASPESLHSTHDIRTHVGMAGLVIGVEVAGTKGARRPAGGQRSCEASLTVLTEEPNRYGNRTGYRAQIEGTPTRRVSMRARSRARHGAPARRADRDYRREPHERTDRDSLAWHGNRELLRRRPWLRRRVYPHRAACGTGALLHRPTPPRAGTFIYHTHWQHDEAQLAGGIYGPLLYGTRGSAMTPRPTTSRSSVSMALVDGTRAIRIERAGVTRAHLDGLEDEPASSHQHHSQ